mgnify:CR=1 FL=1
MGLDEDDEEEEEDEDEFSVEEEPQVAVPTDLSQITRRILADQPRVTKFPIEWHSWKTSKNF